MLIGSLAFVTCKKKSDDVQIATSCTDINLFSISEDIALGAQVDSQIRYSGQYQVLDSSTHVAAYQFLYAMRDSIFAKADIPHENDFKWRIAIIKEDSTLNAFCTPGGYIFVYTGIIKYLDSEDDLAGVLGHEMGHAALRHSTDAIIKEQGLSVLLSILGGNSSKLEQIAAQLALLKYSRCHETQADEFSVVALKDSRFKCDGAASFFKKLLATGSGSSTPVFLSDHPGDADREQNIESRAVALGCDKKVIQHPTTTTEWTNFQSLF